MRIIAGTAKRTPLLAPAGLHTRPTSDLVRGAAMSQLGGFFAGGSALDLCAGTGAVALEFLSRGCQSAVAVENAPEALRCLAANAEKSKLSGRLRVMPLDIAAALRRLTEERMLFDRIWFDPPWEFADYAKILQAIANAPLLGPDGDLLVESRQPLDESACGGFACADCRRYGAGYLQRLRWP